MSEKLKNISDIFILCAFIPLLIDKKIKFKINVLFYFKYLNKNPT